MLPFVFYTQFWLKQATLGKGLLQEETEVAEGMNSFLNSEKNPQKSHAENQQNENTIAALTNFPL